MKKLTTQDFIERARKIHGNFYDYSKVDYKGRDINICIICPIHGEFWQTPHNHINGSKCPKCVGKHRHTTEEWIEEAKKVHGDKYDYSKVIYKGAFERVCIICPKHGEFRPRANNHLNGDGCKKCYHDKQRMTIEEFIKRAKYIHGNKYDYSKVDLEYRDKKGRVCIICPIHGEFWQKPNSHLNGRGCQFCKESKLEKEIAKYLYKNEINYERDFKDKWLGKQHLDFYLPKYNIAIECQGIQHFEPKSFGSHENISLRFNTDIQRDNLKIQKCKEHGIKLIHYNPFEKYFGTYENEIHNVEELKKVLIT